MFCDLLGLSALAAQRDPEDIAELIRACQSAIAAAVARFDGHVAKWVPDGATIYFGYPRAHEDDAERAVRAGLAHATTIATAKFCAQTWPKAVLGDFAALERGSAELVAYCTQKHVEQIRLLASMHCAYARAMREPLAENISAFRAAFDHMRSTGGFTGSSMILSHLAEVALEAGDLARADSDLAQGFAFVEQSGERFWLAELHRLSGQLALRRAQVDRSHAQACFRKAIEIARSQQGRLLELRAANDLARLWRKSNCGGDVRALLEPILETVEGGADTRDVRNAHELLAGVV